MKRFAGVLVVLAIFGIGYLFGACSGGNTPGKGGTVQTMALAQGVASAVEADIAEPKWHDEFDAKATEQHDQDNAKAVPLCWLLKVVLRGIDQDEKNMVFMVTDATGKIMSPKEYSIYIRGYGKSRDLSWAEDFPPVLYP